MTESRRLLQHFLAALAYRAQKALRDAPQWFGDFRAGTHVRTPHELLWHIDRRAIRATRGRMLRGGDFRRRLPTFDAEIVSFTKTLASPSALTSPIQLSPRGFLTRSPSRALLSDPEAHGSARHAPRRRGFAWRPRISSSPIFAPTTSAQHAAAPRHMHRIPIVRLPRRRPVHPLRRRERLAWLDRLIKSEDFIFGREFAPTTGQRCAGDAGGARRAVASRLSASRAAAG